MGTLAGILVIGDDSTGDRVCDDRKTKLGFALEAWPLDRTLRKDRVHVPILLLQRCGNNILKQKSLVGAMAVKLRKNVASIPFM